MHYSILSISGSLPVSVNGTSVLATLGNPRKDRTSPVVFRSTIVETSHLYLDFRGNIRFREIDPEVNVSVAWYVVLERDIPGFAPVMNGKAIPKHAEMLDTIAVQAGLPTLMSFFSASPAELAGFAEDHGAKNIQVPVETWHSPADGLKTVRGLLEAIESQKLDARLTADLREFQAILENASRENVRWHLAIDF